MSIPVQDYGLPETSAASLLRWRVEWALGGKEKKKRRTVLRNESEHKYVVEE
jgi:hypothetical protein